MNLLFDFGGTNLRIASADKNKIKEVLFFPVAKTFQGNLQIFRAAITELGLNKIDKVVGGVPRYKRGQLSIWGKNPTAKVLAKIAKAKVIIENDAALAGLAESQIGAGKGKSIVGYLTFSTGLGGAKIVNGKIDANAFGFEPRLGLRDNFTSYDELVSGRGIKRHFGTKPENLKDKKAWKKIEESIALEINNAAAFWSPDVIVLGGPIIHNKNISLSRIQNIIKKNFKITRKVPKIVLSKLDQLAGLYGALILSMQK